MATANSTLRITELDFDSIKENLKQFLRSQSEFSDFDFEGSGMSVLLDLLAYNTHYMGMYVNLVGNEMFLDTAQLRSSAISLAKLSNYVPTSAVGAKARVNIQVTPGVGEDNAATTLIMDKNTRFVSNPVDSVTYNFMTSETSFVSKSGNSFTFSDIELTQGDLSQQNYLVSPSNTKRRFNIPSDTVDVATLAVTVQESTSSNVITNYTLAGDITELTGNSTVYFIEENSEANGTYTIYFGDGYIGKALTDGNVVKITYLDTQGSMGNKAAKFTAVTGIGGYSANVIVTTVNPAAGGAEKETLEQIRFRAPLHYTAQNRAVTKSDYGVLLQKDYPYIQSVAVWGGEENDPIMYGKIFISIKPKENYSISRYEKEKIVNQIIRDRSVLTVFPEIVDPEYVYVKLKIRANYNPRLTSKSENQLKDSIRQAVLNYKENYLTQFNSTFRKSVLQRFIDDADPSIVSNTLDLLVEKRIEPDLHAAKNYTLRYLMPLSKGNFENKLFAYPLFTIEDIDGFDRECYLEEVPNSLTGIDSIAVINGGSDYLYNPTVIITGDGTGATATAKITNGKVTSITVTNRGSNYTTAAITISGGDGFGASARAVLEFKTGTLRTFYTKTTGEKIVLNDNVGSIDYATGLVKLNNFKPKALAENSFYNPDVLAVDVPPENSVLTPVRNRILDIDQYDSSAIQIIMVPEI